MAEEKKFEDWPPDYQNTVTVIDHGWGREIIGPSHLLDRIKNPKPPVTVRRSRFMQRGSMRPKI